MATEDPLQPLLDEAEAKLHRRLHDACEAEANGIASESAGEIRRLEDSLLSAAMAAQQVLTLRRRMERNAAAGQSSGTATTAAAEAVADESARTLAAAIRQAPEPGTSSPDPSPDASSSAEQRQPGEGGEQLATSVREFKDCKGQAWRAWPVTPGSARPGQPTRRTLGEFQEGWICFESLDDAARRRLPRRETQWSQLREDELEHLLDQAIAVPGRKQTSAQTHQEPDARLH